MYRDLVNVGTTTLAVHDTGPEATGLPVVLVHGWPHTGLVWRDVVPLLRDRRRVVVPDVRGIGASARPAGGYDGPTLADDLLRLADTLGLDQFAVVAIDAGVTAAFLLALDRPDRVARLVLTEGLVPGLATPPGAASRWWFGFHAVPGLAERVLAGHEGEYLDHFLDGPSVVRPLPNDVRAAFIEAYTGGEALRAGFEHYRHLDHAASVVSAALARGERLRVPTLAVGGGVVGDALHRQLVPVADDLATATVDDCGHVVPLEQPGALAGLVDRHLGEHPR